MSFLYIPLRVEGEKVCGIMNLREGGMSVREYFLKFNQLTKYAKTLVADPRVRMKNL